VTGFERHPWQGRLKAVLDPVLAALLAVLLSPVLLAIAVGIGSQYLPPRIPRLVMARFSRLPVLGQATVLALALMLTSVMGPEGVAPFIYFQF